MKKYFPTAFLGSAVLWSIHLILSYQTASIIAITNSTSSTLRSALMYALYILSFILGCFICKLIGKGILKSDYDENLYFRKVGRITMLTYDFFLVFNLFAKLRTPFIQSSFSLITAGIISAFFLYVINLGKPKKNLFKLLLLFLSVIVSLGVAEVSLLFFSTMKIIVPFAAVSLLVFVYCKEE